MQEVLPYFQVKTCKGADVLRKVVSLCTFLQGFRRCASKSLSQSDAYWSNAEEVNDQTNQLLLHHSKSLSKSR